MIGYKVKVDENGKFRLPSDLMKKVGINTGDYLRIMNYENGDFMLNIFDDKKIVSKNEVTTQIDSLCHIKLDRDLSQYVYLGIDTIENFITVSNNQFEKVVFKTGVDSLNRIIIKNEIKEAMGIDNVVYLHIPQDASSDMILKSNGTDEDIKLELDNLNRVTLSDEVAERLKEDIYVRYDFKNNTCTITKNI